MKIEKMFAESMQYLASRISFWATYKATFEPITNLLDELGANYDVTSYSFECTMSEGTSKMLKLHQLLTELGWVSNEELPAGPVSYLLMSYTKLNNPNINVYWSNTLCKRIQIGTQIIEQPVYKLECDEERTPYDEVVEREQDAVPV